MRYAVLLLVPVSLPAGDADAIIRRSLQRDQRNRELLKNYTYQEEVREKKFDGDGRVKAVETETHEISILYGEPYERLVLRNGKSLAPGEERKEQEKLDRLMVKRARETPEQSARRMEDQRRQREKERAFLNEVPDAFRFSLAGEQRLGERDAWVLEAEPKPDYKHKDRRAGVLTKLKGRFFIDKTDYQWVRVEAEFLRPARFGVFLVKILEGTRVEFEQVRINDEVWLPARVHARLEGKLGLIKRARYEYDVLYSNYRRFSTDSRLVAASPAKVSSRP